jgi:predicted component of type VI protein secretion system
MKLTDLRKIINEEIQNVLNTEAFGPGGKNVQIGTPNAPGKKGKRFIPSIVKLPKNVRDAFKKEFKLVKDKEGKYTLFISKDLHAALNARASGQTSSTAKASLKLVNDINALGLPQELKSLLKKTGNLNSSLGMYSVAVNIKDITPEGDIIFDNPATSGTLNTFEGLINEVMDALMAEETHNPVDDIGKFFVAKKPKKGMTKEEMVYEATVFDEINPEDTLIVHKNKSEVNRTASEALKAYEDQLKEVESSMEEIRKEKESLKTKAQAAKEKINKMK